MVEQTKTETAQSPELIRLETRYGPDTGRFQIRVDGRWRHNRSWSETCPRCYEQDEEVALDYHGIRTTDGVTKFWGVCPRCGHRSTPTWVGKLRESGDQEHGWLRFRRARAGY